MSRVTMPKQKPGKSVQTYETPPEFLFAVVRRFGPLVWDLAALIETRKARFCYTPEEDALVQDWSAERHRGTNWLNPPFGRIAPWARKAHDSLYEVLAMPGRRDRHDWRVPMLTPASVASEWFARHVHGHALVLPLRPRITFVGEADPFPKDLMLSVFGERPGFEPWRWD